MVVAQLQGARPFMDSSAAAATSVVSSMDYEDSLDDTFGVYPRTCSFRYTPTAATAPTGKRVGASSSSRFSFTASGHFDSLKPWYLSRIDATIPEQSQAYSFNTPALVSPLNARSYSFASPAARSSRPPPATPTTPRTPRPFFLQSPAAFFRKEGGAGHGAGRRNAFLPYLRFYRRPYDEMVYRSKMRPPLGGLISIVSPSVKRRTHCTFSSHRF